MNDDSIRKAAEIIRRGGLVAFPTETVYGLGADAFNPMAVARVFEVKQRPYFDPLIVHIGDRSEIINLVKEIPYDAERLIERFWPGPLTLVLYKKENVPDIVTSGLQTIAVRMPKHEMTLKLIKVAETPIVGPSANPFGYLSPTRAQDVREQLGDQIDFILDGGPCEVGVESTILSFAEERPKLLRPGGIPLEEIEAIIGKVRLEVSNHKKPTAPGMLPRHYAPRTPILLNWKEEMKENLRDKRIGLLAFKEPNSLIPFSHIEILSKKGDLREAAANLFSAIRRLDNLGLDLIFAEPIPEVGLGRAIMDRLRRASHKGDIN